MRGHLAIVVMAGCSVLVAVACGSDGSGGGGSGGAPDAGGDGGNAAGAGGGGAGDAASDAAGGTANDAANDTSECTVDAASCGPHASCTGTLGGYECICDPGYAGDGTTCTDIDECALGTDTCKPPHECRNFDGGYDCACPVGLAGPKCDVCEHGYEAAGDASTSCVPATVDCTADPTYCDPGGLCVAVTGGTDYCKCSAGYAGAACAHCEPGYQDNDGNLTCEPSCALSGLVCSAPHTECSDASGTAECACSRGYEGAKCDQCATGFEDVAKDGTCVAVTCAAAQLDCGSHGACYDQTKKPACLCAIGFQGATCASCASTHSPDGSGGCVFNMTHGTHLLAPAVDDIRGPVIAAIDLVGFGYSPVFGISTQLTGLAYDPANDRLFGLKASYPAGLVEIDTKTGALTTLYGLSSYHSVHGLAWDSKRSLLYVHTTIGAGQYFVQYDPVAKSGSSSGMSFAGACGGGFDSETDWGYDAGADRLSKIAGYVSGWSNNSSCRFNVDVATHAPSYVGPLVPAGMLIAPGIVQTSGNVATHISGQLGSTAEAWAAAFCADTAKAMGVDTTGYDVVAEGSYNGVPAGQELTWSSSSTGPRLFAHVSYGSSTATPRNVQVATTNPGDVGCIITYEETLNLVVQAASKFRLLIVASSKPTLTLSVDSAFQPAPTVPQPISAYVSGGTIDTSFNVPLVKLYSSSQWSALGLTSPYYNPKEYSQAVAGTVSWTTGATTLHPIDGITFTGGLTAY